MSANEDNDMLHLKSAEAKIRFDELIQAALRGDTVVIELENGRRVKLVAESDVGVLPEPGTGQRPLTKAPDINAPPDYDEGSRGFS